MCGLNENDPIAVRRSGILTVLAVMAGIVVSLLGVVVPAHADPGTLSGAFQFPAGMDAPDLATNVEETTAIASFDRGDDEIHYEVVATNESNTKAITAWLVWDVDSSQLRWSVSGIGTAKYRVFVFWSRWVYTGPIPKQQDSKQFWLSESSTTMLGSMAQATLYPGGTSSTQFHCAYGFEGCTAGGGGNAPSVVAGTPKISGTARVGQKLSVSAGSWQPAGASLTYQWLRDGKSIAGATSTGYVPTTVDLGKKLSVKVTGSLAGYVAKSATSAPTAAVARGELVASTPKVAGTATVGRTLTAKAGTWKPVGVTLRYQWLRGVKEIAGATGPSYKLKKADKGKRIGVRVTASKPGYTSASATSAPTAKVKKKR